MAYDNSSLISAMNADDSWQPGMVPPEYGSPQYDSYIKAMYQQNWLTPNAWSWNDLNNFGQQSYDQSHPAPFGLSEWLAKNITQPAGQIDEAINPVRQIPALDQMFSKTEADPLPAIVTAMIGGGLGAAAGAAAGAAGGAATDAGAAVGDGAGGTIGSTAGAITGDLPAITVTGTSGGLAGASVGAGIAGNIGTQLVNGQIQPQQPTTSLDPVYSVGSNSAAGVGAYGGLGASAAGAASSLDPVNVNAQNPNTNGLSTTDWLGLAGAGAALGSGLSQYNNTSSTTGNNNNGNNPVSGFDWTNLIGPLINAGGSLLGSNASNQASTDAIKLAQQGAYPYNVNLPGYGQSTFDPTNRTATLTPDASLTNFQNQNTNLANTGYQGLQGLLNSPFGSSGYGSVSPQLQGMFDQNQASPYRQPTSNIYGSPQVFSGLLNQAGTTAQNSFQGVGQNLPGLQGSNNYLGAGQGFLNQASNFDTSAQEATNLARLRASAQFGESQAQQNNLESQFGKGILASTAGGYQTQGLNNALQTADVQRQALAHQMAMGDQSQLLQNSLGATSAGFGGYQANQGLQQGQLGQALQALGGYQNLQQTGFGQSFQNNSYGNDTTNQSFQNALNMFGVGMNSQQQQYGQQNQVYNQGQAGSLNIGGYLQGLLGLGGNLGALSSGASGQAAGIAANQGAANGNLYAGLFNNLAGSVDWSKLFGSSTAPKTTGG